MNEPPQPEYTVVERDGRLVVEKVAEARPGRLSKIRLPELPALRSDVWTIGQSLLTRFIGPDITEDGHALMTASQLEPFIKLSARPYDLYYLTPRQQAIIGYLAALQSNGAILIVIGGAFMMAFGTWLIWLFMLGGVAAATMTTYFMDDYKAIALQEYTPTAPAPEQAAPPAP